MKCQYVIGNFVNLVVDGVKLGENDPVDEARLVRHGVVRQGLVELHLDA